jgi:hypothetical protein
MISSCRIGAGTLPQVPNAPDLKQLFSDLQLAASPAASGVEGLAASGHVICGPPTIGFQSVPFDNQFWSALPAVPSIAPKE